MPSNTGTTKINRWWLASTSFPVLAGTLCTMAIMFNICAVCQGWQAVVEVGGGTGMVSQPAWVIVLKAASLSVAAAAYLFFLTTMMSKRDPIKGFAVTIFGWFTSASILFSLIGVNVRRHPKVRLQQSVEYTQNFFSGILAAMLYAIISILMIIYTVSAHSVHLHHKDRRSVETTGIILRAATLAAFLLGGAAVYSAIEGWSLMDALYFTDYTILTIGIGNLVPTSHLGRSLLFPYATGGIITLGLLISSITSFAKNMSNMKLKFTLQEAQIHIHEQAESWDGGIDGGRNDSDKKPHHTQVTHQFRKNEVSALHRAKSNFYRKRRWRVFFFSLAAWFVLWLVSAGIFRISERRQDWSYFIALYFTYTSLTTIGYGDLYPTSNFGKVFFVFWSLISIPVLTNLVTSMGEIGFRTLAYFFKYIWRFCHLKPYRRQRYRRRNDPQSCESKTGDRAIEKRSDPESLLSVTNMGRQVQGPVVRKQSYEDIKKRGGGQSGSASNRFVPPKSMSSRAQRRLLLAEEIEKLTAALADESTMQYPYRNWARIFSLLNAGEDGGSNPLESTSPDVFRNDEKITKTTMSAGNLAADRKAEILWMLTLLVEKLCSDLREECTDVDLQHNE